MFPTDKNLSSGYPSAAVSFIEEMTTGGGGEMYGEALIDGLAQANKLNYRIGSGRMYILMCDDSPHGDEFLAGTTYGKGCPCGHQ